MLKITCTDARHKFGSAVERNMVTTEQAGGKVAGCGRRAGARVEAGALNGNVYLQARDPATRQRTPWTGRPVASFCFET